MTTPATTGYQAPNVRLYEPDDNTLLRISCNDPDVAGLHVYPGRKLIDTGSVDRAGRAISNSLHLRKLEITLYTRTSVWNTEQMTTFFTHLANNRSLEHLEISGSGDHTLVDIFAILAPFFKLNHKLRCIEIHGNCFAKRVQSLISALQRSKTNCLERISVSSCSIRDDDLALLINALNVKPGLNNLSELCLAGNKLDDLGCFQLGLLLKNPTSGIQCLNLCRNGINDEGVVYLVTGLLENRTLKSLDLSRVGSLSSESCRVLSIFLTSPNCLLERLSISGDSEIDDNGATYLGDAFSANNTLECLDFSENHSISSYGWQQMARCLPGAILEELSLSDCWIDDDGALPLFVALAANTSLKKLYMSDNDDITVQGWNACLPFLRNSGAPFEELFFSNNNIDGIGASMVVDMVANMKSTVVFLDMYDIAVTADELSIFSDVMQASSSSKLTDLLIGGCRRDHSSTVLHDDVIRGFATALANNTTLTYLEVSDINISSSGFSALADVLCDKSDGVNSIFNSNHTLGFCCDVWLPPVLDSLLTVNGNENKEEVVRQKIVVHYLSDMETSGHVFGSMPEATLPTAIGWIGRDRHGYSAMFCLVRNMILNF